MQILYPDYKFNLISIIVVALGYIQKCLNRYMWDLGFDKKEAVKHMNDIQRIIASSTVNICKTFLTKWLCKETYGPELCPAILSNP